MSRISIVKVSMNVMVTVPSTVLEEGVGCLPQELGVQLAQQVYDYSEREGLGYFPPLVYCSEHKVVDPELLSLHQRVAGYACQFAAREVRIKVTPVFSNLRIEQVQSTAYAMPHMRVGHGDAKELLARHFAPDQVKMELVVSSLQRAEFDGIEQLSAKKVRRWLERAFDAVDVAGAHICSK